MHYSCVQSLACFKKNKVKARTSAFVKGRQWRRQSKVFVSCQVSCNALPFATAVTRSSFRLLFKIIILLTIFCPIFFFFLDIIFSNASSSSCFLDICLWTLANYNKQCHLLSSHDFLHQVLAEYRGAVWGVHQVINLHYNWDRAAC